MKDVIERMHEVVDIGGFNRPCQTLCYILFGENLDLCDGDYNRCGKCSNKMEKAINELEKKFSSLNDKNEVLDSTGESIHVGDEMHSINSNNSGIVKDIVPHWEFNVLMGACWYAAKDLRHKKAEEDVVLDADGVPIHVGDVVYGKISGWKYIVKEVHTNVRGQRSKPFIVYENGGFDSANLVTHTKPYFTSDNYRIFINDTLYGNDGVEWRVYGFNENNESYPIMGTNKYNGRRGLKPEWLHKKQPLDEEIIEFKLNKYKNRFEKAGIQWCDIEHVRELMDNKERYETDNW